MTNNHYSDVVYSLLRKSLTTRYYVLFYVVFVSLAPLSDAVGTRVLIHHSLSEWLSAYKWQEYTLTPVMYHITSIRRYHLLIKHATLPPSSSIYGYI